MRISFLFHRFSFFFLFSPPGTAVTHHRTFLQYSIIARIRKAEPESFSALFDLPHFSELDIPLAFFLFDFLFSLTPLSPEKEAQLPVASTGFQP